MNSTAYKILRLVFVLLFVYIIVTGISSFLPRGLSDSQCWVRYDEANQCVEDHQTGSNYQIESFLSTYMVGWANGGCNYKHAEGSTLDVPTSVKNLHFERDGNDLIVNGKILEGGNKFRFVEILNSTPWIISKMEFENIGLVASCNSPSTDRRILIVGSYGTKISLPKGLILLTVSVGGYIFMNKKIKAS